MCVTLREPQVDQDGAVFLELMHHFIRNDRAGGQRRVTDSAHIQVLSSLSFHTVVTLVQPRVEQYYNGLWQWTLRRLSVLSTYATTLCSAHSHRDDFFIRTY